MNPEFTNKDTKVVYLADHPDLSGGAVGDRADLLEKTFQEYRPVLLRFLAARLVLEADREDLIQELFLKLANMPGLSEKLSTVTGDTKSYLFTIINNLVIDRQRQEAARGAGRHSSLEEGNLPAEHANPEQLTATREQLDGMMAVLSRIQPKFRNVLIMNRFMHKSGREIAEEMGVSEATVERYLAKALTSLRRGLKQEHLHHG